MKIDMGRLTATLSLFDIKQPEHHHGHRARLGIRKRLERQAAQSRRGAECFRRDDAPISGCWVVWR